MTDQIDNNRTGLELAVIGMSGRFPGAENLEQFWHNLKNGVDSISFFSDEELIESGIPPEFFNKSNYVRAYGILENKEYFDAFFFNYTKADADVMDPQMRILHECAWQAMEDAGCAAETDSLAIGLYLGASANFNWEAITYLSQLQGDSAERFTGELLRNKDYISTRISYSLNLTGPSVILYSACSTSLLAVDLGCRGILTGQCDIAVAGGACISCPPRKGHNYLEGMINSPDGHCRAFDRHAKGCTFVEGVGIVVLKALENALADGDSIYAVIKGSAVNNDGSRKVGFTAPGIKGQTDVIKSALYMARVQPESIGYIETHGTGTALGDPIEIRALINAFASDKKGFCVIGSLKSNLGHLDAAAGVAGLIKTVLMLKHRLIPPSLHFEEANPEIDFANSPFYVNTGLKEWHNDKYPLRAGVSAFGIGGTNIHIILEEAPEIESTAGNREYQLLLLSAGTAGALERMTGNLKDFLKKKKEINLADAAYTLQVGRKNFSHKRSLVCRDIDDAVERLTNPAKLYTSNFNNDPISVVFLFPGQGAQYVHMGIELYRSEYLFKAEIDRCIEIVSGELGRDFRDTFFPAKNDKAAAKEFYRFENTLLIIFIFEYALAKLLIGWGIEPAYMIGYSFGEYVAACLAGVFSLHDILRLIIIRGKLTQKTEKGIMLSVPLTEEELRPKLNEKLSLSIINGPSCIVSGKEEAINDFEEQLKREKYLSMCLNTSYAVHSHLMEPILPEFAQAVQKLMLASPEKSFYSSLSGKLITAAQAGDPQYWVSHLRHTVRFSACVEELVKEDNLVFVEVGPGRDLTTLIDRFLNKERQQYAVSLVRNPRQKVAELEYLLKSLGRLWGCGITVNPEIFYGNEKRRRISLPTYPFEKIKYPLGVDPVTMFMEKFPQQIQASDVDISEWFYVPKWSSSLIVFENEPDPGTADTILCFMDDFGVGRSLVKELSQQQIKTVTVKCGSRFGKIKEFEYEMNPGRLADYEKLFAELKRNKKIPGKILHLWSLSDDKLELPGSERFAGSQVTGFYSLIKIVRGLQTNGLRRELDIIVITNGLGEITGEEILLPGQATLIGPLRSIPQEHPYLTCRCIDIILPGDAGSELILAKQLAREMQLKTTDSLAAYRGKVRWVEEFELFKLDETRIGSHKLRPNGVYLVTGGLGVIGLELVEFFSLRSTCALVLTGRSAFPPRREWQEITADPTCGAALKKKIEKLLQVEQAGSRVMIFQADAGDLERMRQVVNRVEEEVGPVTGIVHAAGIVRREGFAGVLEIEESMCDTHFRAKVQGLFVLAEIFRDHELEFCWLLSSVAAVLGGLGFSAYTAANSFMDVFVRKYNRDNNCRWLSIDWDGMSAEKGTAAFDRLFSLAVLDRIVVSTGGRLQDRIDKWVKRETVIEDDQVTAEPGSLQPRSVLSSDYEAPRNDTEKTLAGIWQDLFGIEKIGTADDFFELGGDSLKAMTMSGRIYRKLDIEIPVVKFFNCPTIAELAKFIEDSEAKEFASIRSVEKKEYYPVTSDLQRIYLLDILGREDSPYHIFNTLRINRQLNKEQLEKTFKALIKRHEILRTSFELQQEELVQVVHETFDFRVEYINTGEGKVGNIAARFNQPFDLSKIPLLRVAVISFSEKEHILVYDMPHTISDGLTMGILPHDYEHLEKDRHLPGLRIQYKDFSEWQSKLAGSKEMKKQEEFWLSVFKGNIPVLDLPLDFPRPPVQDFAGDELNYQLEDELSRRLTELIKESETTLFMVILTVFFVILFKYTGQEDIIIGTTSAGRNHPDLEDVIGMFIKTLAIRCFPRGEKSFGEFLQEVKKNVLQVFENQDYPFKELLDHIPLQKDLSRNPLFDVLLIVQNIVSENNRPDMKLINNARAQEDEVERGVTKKEVLEIKNQLGNVEAPVDIQLTVWFREEKIILNLVYCIKLFKRETMERFLYYFTEIIAAVTEDKNIKLQDIQIAHDFGLAAPALNRQAESEFIF